MNFFNVSVLPKAALFYKLEIFSLKNKVATGYERKAQCTMTVLIDKYCVCIACQEYHNRWSYVSF